MTCLPLPGCKLGTCQMTGDGTKIPETCDCMDAVSGALCDQPLCNGVTGDDGSDGCGDHGTCKHRFEVYVLTDLILVSGSMFLSYAEWQPSGPTNMYL